MERLRCLGYVDVFRIALGVFRRCFVGLIATLAVA